MHLLLRIIVFFMDPLGLGRRFFVRPALKMGNNMYDQMRTKADEKMENVKDLVLKLGLVAFAVVLILWAAVFMYAAFYYAYMPSISHTRQVHMQFKTCAETSAPCSFPHAHVSLNKKQQLLMEGQAYKVIVNIDMPESPQNLELGMFMVCAEMRDHESILRGHSCRSAMMKYRSPLIRTLTTWAFSPALVLGIKEELQRVNVEIFSRYFEVRNHPITDVYVEIQSQKIQFYTVSLHIVADFAGLRYIMFNYPIISAVVAISTNLFFILVVFLLSWYHWSDTTWLRNIQDKYARLTNTVQNVEGRRAKLKAKAAGLSIDDEDDEDTSLLEIKNESSDIEELSDFERSKSKREQGLVHRKKH